MWSSRAFQVAGPACENARSPNFVRSRGRKMALKWPFMCWCAVKKLLSHVVESSPSMRWKMSVARNVICWRRLTGLCPACKLSDEVLLWLSAWSEVFAYGPLHPKTPSSLDSFKSRLVLPFWYRCSQVVLEKAVFRWNKENSIRRGCFTADHQQMYSCYSIWFGSVTTNKSDLFSMDFVINYLKQVILTMSDIVQNVFHLICQTICSENEWLTSTVNLPPSMWKCS